MILQILFCAMPYIVTCAMTLLVCYSVDMLIDTYYRTYKS